MYIYTNLFFFNNTYSHWHGAASYWHYEYHVILVNALNVHVHLYTFEADYSVH